MADFPIAVGFGEKDPVRIAKALRELHAHLQRQPVHSLYRFKGVGGVDYPIYVPVPDEMRLPRVVSVNARTDPDDSSTVEALGCYWFFESTRRRVAVASINNLTTGTRYVIDFAITGERT